jgi:serine/threonine protein kinase
VVAPRAGDEGGSHRGRSRVALGDFGIARELAFDGGGGGGADAMARTFVGTPVFMAPEMFKRKPYDHKADVWAAGCVLYEMMQLSEPFRARTMGELTRMVQHQARPLSRRSPRDRVGAVHADPRGLFPRAYLSLRQADPSLSIPTRTPRRL